MKEMLRVLGSGTIRLLKLLILHVCCLLYLVTCNSIVLKPCKMCLWLLCYIAEQFSRALQSRKMYSSLKRILEHLNVFLQTCGNPAVHVHCSWLQWRH